MSRRGSALEGDPASPGRAADRPSSGELRERTAGPGAAEDGAKGGGGGGAAGEKEMEKMTTLYLRESGFALGPWSPERGLRQAAAAPGNVLAT